MSKYGVFSGWNMGKKLRIWKLFAQWSSWVYLTFLFDVFNVKLHALSLDSYSQHEQVNEDLGHMKVYLGLCKTSVMEPLVKISNGWHCAKNEVFH